MELKIELSTFVEIITDAHMAGQHDAGCPHASYGNARAYYTHGVENKIKNLGESSSRLSAVIGCDEGWISCADKLPEIGECVLTCNINGICSDEREPYIGFIDWEDGKSWYRPFVEPPQELTPTHWMPRPKIPDHGR